MRCKNCGWINEDGVSVCEKCHAPLESTANSGGTESISDRVHGTVSERIIFDEPESESVALSTCPQCGYPISPGMSSCPNCEYSLGKKLNKESKCPKCGKRTSSEDKFCSSCGWELSSKIDHISNDHIQRSGLGTIMAGPSSNPETNVFCTLKPIAWNGEDVSYNPITYSGDQIILNRANTDANNNSITSKIQAILTYEDGEWYIENKSELNSTYIRLGHHKVKLDSGDVIVLGNREFEFKK